MLNTKSGISIYLAVIITAVLFAIVFGLNAILLGQIKTIRNIGYSVNAFYAAETGAEKALYDNKNIEPVSYSYSGSLDNGASYSVLLLLANEGDCPEDSSYCLLSTGSFGSTTRAVQTAVAGSITP